MCNVCDISVIIPYPRGTGFSDFGKKEHRRGILVWVLLAEWWAAVRLIKTVGAGKGKGIGDGHEDLEAATDDGRAHGDGFALEDFKLREIEIEVYK